jgi:asparagine synthase (glutamine-hydrolysing)
MRAIAGFWSFGKSAGPDSCASMLRAISQNRADILQPASDVVLGSSDYRPDPQMDARPASSPAALNVFFVADLRIDNHDALVRDFGLTPGVSDDELLAHAWARWQWNLLDRLIGGFAFVCWDPQSRTLFAARDHTGERPLHFTRYSGPGNGFAFASTPPGLCALPSVGHRLNLPHMAHFLAALSASGTDTFFEGIEVLPPGHWMKVSASGIEVRRYWHPMDAPAIRYRNDDDYIEDFRERFDRAVGARLAGDGDVASQLSGGLDSSSVTATAARLLAPEGRQVVSFTSVPVPAYDGSALFGRFGDEGAMAAEVAAFYPNIQHIRVDAAGRDIVSSASLDASRSGQPTFNPTNRLWIDAILDGARERGLSVLLQGTCGNATISFGGLIGLSDLARKGRWFRLFQVVRTLRAGGHTSWRGAAGWSTGWLVPQLLRRLYHPGLRDFNLDFSAVHPRLASEYRLREKAIEEFYGVETTTESVRRSLYEYYDPGVYNAVAAAGWQVEQRDPTQDKRIFEFCFGIPVEQYLVGGQGRSLIRRAMQGRLPESTLRRTTRGLQAADWYLTVAAARPQLYAELARIERSPLASRIVDTARLRKLIDTWPTSGYDTSEVSDAWHLALTRGMAAGSFIAQHDPDAPREYPTEKPGA